MNQQLIEQLAEQANFKKDKFVVGYWDMPECQKFVELVVKECAQVIFETPVEYTETDAMHRIRDRVKKHFGVEE
jgi:hypothetical protein